MYITYNGKNMSVKHITKEFENIILQDVMDVLEGKVSSNTNIIKKLNDEMSVRKGRYGHYVYYKTNKMKKPKFIPIKGVNINEVNVEWVQAKL